MGSAVVVTGPDEAQSGNAASLERVADVVAPLVADLAVACPPDRRSAVATALDDVSHRIAVDPTVDGGPVAAIRAGCRLATGSRRLVDALARLEDVAVVDAPDLGRSDEPTGARTPDATTPASVVGS